MLDLAIMGYLGFQCKLTTIMWAPSKLGSPLIIDQKSISETRKY